MILANNDLRILSCFLSGQLLETLHAVKAHWKLITGVFAAGASVVVVDAAHRIERREVSLGLETPERVEVTAGLREDDLVVLGNRRQLKPGTTVAPQLQSVQAEQ